MVEIFALPPASESDLPFSGIMYVRPTPLGLYVGKKGEKPDLSAFDSFIREYDLIENPMMIVGRKQNNPYDSWIDNIGTRIGRRWSVTTGSFLKNVNNILDLDELIADFKEYVCAEPPKRWTDFFAALSNNVGRNVGCYENQHYTVIKLNPANRELLDYLATTPQLSKIAIKAEGCRLLIKKENLPAFKDILRQGGFIIT